MPDGQAHSPRHAARTAVAAAGAALLISVAGCSDGRDGGAHVEAAAAHAPVYVDSIFPIEEEVRRFRAELPEVAKLEGGAASRDALVAEFLDALERRDPGAMQALAISPAEFAWLYYPHTHFTSRPYELSPALVWFQLENYGGKGRNRALARHGGERIDGGYECEAPKVEGPNTLHACVVRRVLPTGDTASVSLFGPILEREGRFKFVSLANGL